MTDRPLQGKTILVTRAKSQAGEMTEKIRQLGGEVVEFPVIQLLPPRDLTKLDQVIHDIEHYDWILFTSVNGVHFFMKRMEELGVEISSLRSQIGAVGPRTASVLETYGLHVDVVAKEYTAEGLLQELGSSIQVGTSLLLPRANIARKVLPEQLLEWGMRVDDVVVYETVQNREGIAAIQAELKQGKIDIVTFTSSSTVKNFCEMLDMESDHALLDGIKIACIGPITAQTARSLGLEVDGIAEKSTIEDLVNLLARI
ncbi:uroporphyrinogen-III synthase [Ammoniphilus resinae]|uniref:Uroporphyrinogen-III synthase n=1 Tax=Ammoniphilus resinae TaxID=861532 RepID=A0ABS4GJF2_9BACL|nr:uroporphyrinogen-III synthase [Ammoniphilus resinae]MBP1930392.1 uroporphyrinogen-III synthase [Ammoniphilus resinae]